MVRRGARGPWIATLVALVTWAGVEGTASAGNGVVQGKHGLEIEGPRDRRGFFVGGGIAFGGTFFWADDFMPATRIDLALGGGLTKRFTLGVDLHVTPYLMKGVGVAFGGDVEATGYVFRGLFLRAGLGASGVPKREQTNQPDAPEGLTVGLGGAGSVGYEFFLSAAAALGVAFTYDVRYVPGSKFPRQTLLLGARFSYF